MKIKPSLYFLGLSCFPISILSLINIFYCFYFNYTENLTSYLILIALSLIIGFIFLSFGKKNTRV